MSVVAPPEPPRPDELELLIREARARQRRRRLAAAATLAVSTAAALAVYSSLAGNASTIDRSRSGSPAPLSSVSRCRSAQLRLTAPKMWGAAAGSLIEGFTLINTSQTTCFVAGWPAVRPLDRAGHPIATAVRRWVYAERGRAPFRRVDLRSGAAAGFPVVGADWNHAADRACPTARTVRVAPPGGGGWLSVALKLPACGSWNVGPLVAGRQAPWPSFALSEFYAVNGMTYSGWQGRARWKLTARDSGDGRYCFTVFTNGIERGRKCGRLYQPGIVGKLGVLWRSSGARPSFVAGAVISRAQVVTVRISHGQPRYVLTMSHTRRLAPGISFFFTTVPLGASPVSIVGHTHASHRVFAWRRP